MNDTAASIQAWLISRLASQLRLTPADVDVRASFSRLGLDSAGATALMAQLSPELGRPLSPTILWQYTTVEELAQGLANGGAAASVPDRVNAAADEPIAVVGLACRFPGASNVEAFWRMLCDGTDAIREVPPDRWDLVRHYDADPTVPGKVCTRQGGFLDRLDEFDPLFFGISPREAVDMDPQQRLMLELSWEALEDAGVPPPSLKGSRTAVFVGTVCRDYSLTRTHQLESLTSHSGTGHSTPIIANRVSYALGLQGPSLVVDTACSSALVAAHLACQSLRAGEATLALVGGANLLLSLDIMVAASKFGGLSPDGRCKTFDARADGYGRGEGAGVVVLRPLSQALAHGDPIYCVIRGSAVNNDGASNGLTAPNPLAQVSVLRDAYAQAGRAPRDVHYVEAHGTGTPLGDPIEAKALSAVLCEGRPADHPLRIGSVKTNIGHLEGGAGIAGIIKLALALKRRVLPPSLNFETPNPHIQFEALNLKVQTRLEPWPSGAGPALAGVSSFGWGGTNAHAVLEALEPRPACLFPIAAAAPEALRSLASEWATSLASDHASTWPLEAVCATAASRLTPESHRLALAAQSRGEVLEQLRAYLAGRSRPGLFSGVAGAPGRLVFVFAPHGAYWCGMGRQLMAEEPVFRATVERVDRAFQRLSGLSIVEELNLDEKRSRLHLARVMQPVLFAMQVALVELLKSWGIEPDAVVGHSIGEMMAAYVAGALQFDDAIYLLHHMSRLWGTMEGQGGMAAIRLRPAHLEEALAPYQGKLTISGYYSPKMTTISGDVSLLNQLLSATSMVSKGNVLANVNAAAHSPWVEDMSRELRASLDGLRTKRAAIPFASTVTGDYVEGQALDGSYWARNVREPVRFCQAIERLAEDGYDCFLEISPVPSLVPWIRETLSTAGRKGVVLASLQRNAPERSALLESLGALYTLGRPVRFDRLLPGDVGHVPLPAPVASQGVPSLAAPSTVELLPLSARDPEALRGLAASMRAFVADHGDQSLRDACSTAMLHRAHHEHRLAVTGHTAEEVATRLDAFVRGERTAGVSSGRCQPGRIGKVAFVFSGNGSQWPRMGSSLFAREPVFREAIERCAAALGRYTDWSILDELQADEERSCLGRAHLSQLEVQPCIFAVQVALAALWRSWGIEPTAVVGHSVGEVAAAHVSGALNLEDAARIICRRGQLAARTSGQGGMALVELPLDLARAAIAGHEHELSIAATNGPRTTLLSGAPAALKEVLATLERQGLFCRLVKIDYAPHSPQMDALRDDFLTALEGIECQRGAVPLYSTVTGEVEDGLRLDAEYWARNLREPVLFHPMTKRLLADGCRVFLEVSPHPVLVPALEETLRQSGEGSVALPSLRRSEDERGSLLGSAGMLYTLGYPLEWPALQPEGGRFIRLPTYPFQRERFWPEAAKVSRRRGGASGHPLLGSHVRLSDPPDTHLWETELTLDELPYLRDHRVGDAAVFPATAYVELALAAAREALGDGLHVVQDLSLRQMLSLPEGGSRVVQVVLTASGRGAASFRVFSRPSDDTAPEGGWVLHGEGAIVGGSGGADAAAPQSSIAALEARCEKRLSADDHYRVTSSIGLPYGPQFRGVVELRCGAREALARVRPTDAVRAQAEAYRVHPALLDACLQGLLTLAVGHEAKRPTAYLPVSIGQTTLHAPPPASEALWCHLVLRETGEAHAETLEGDARVLREDGGLVLEMLGIHLRRLEPRAADQLGDWLYETSWERQVLPPASLQVPAVTPESWLLFADRGGVAEGLVALLEQTGHRAVLVSPGAAYRTDGATRFEIDPARPEDFGRLLEEALPAGTPPCRHLVHLHALDTSPLAASSAARLKAEQPLASAGLLHLIQAVSRANFALAPRLTLVTRGARSVEAGTDSVAVEQAPVWGLARAIAHEHPELGCRCVDLNPVASADDTQALLAELLSTDGEEQVALRSGARHVARLLQRSKTPAQAPQEPPVTPAGERPFRLELPSVGVLDRLQLRAIRRSPPGPGEVEIEVAAAGVNFLDVLLALGVIPDDQPGGPHLGGECAGTVAAVGEGVTHLALGQRVMAVAPSSFATHVTTSSLLVAPIPEGVSFEEAATIPIVFLTAYHALVRVGRLSKGERVLIHAGAGGVGLAAVQVAQYVGAEIFATAGSPEKRDFLRSLGVQHVFDSRSLAFAGEIRSVTNGEGVDVVLNSLAGEFIPTSFGLLRKYGRFVEIGKRDYYEDRRLGLKPFLNNLTFSLVDLRGMSQERPALIAELLREVGPLFASGALQPLVHRVFPIVEAKAAFRTLAQAKHIGKLVLSLHGRAQAPILEAEGERGFRADATYLVTGGLGGIGLEVVRWMIAEGARHVAIMSRRGAASPEALKELEQSGAKIRVFQADVGDEASVARAFAQLEGAMPPLRGLVHSAAILQDGTLLRMTQEQLWAVLAPKAVGAWNLHRLTLGKELDFFVLLSSVAAVLGSPGQANYCAANAFLDALAHHRRRLGLPGQSLQWGPWNRVGLAALAANRGERLDARGVDGLEPEQGIAALARLVHDEGPEIAIMSFDFGKWRHFYPKVAGAPLFSRLERPDGAAVDAPAQPSLRAMLLAAEPWRRRDLLEEAIRDQVALVVRVPSAKLNVTAPLATLGLDSLMALELRNRLEAVLGLSLPSTLVWSYPTIHHMGPHLAAKLDIALDETAVGAKPEPARAAGSASAAAAVEGISDEHAEALLRAELDELAQADSHPRGTPT